MTTKILFSFLLSLLYCNLYCQSYTISNSLPCDKYLLIGIQNPLITVAENCSIDSIILTTDNGTIEKHHSQFMIMPSKVGFASITLKKVSNHDTIIIGNSKLAVKYFPDPVIYVANKKEGTIDKDILAAQIGLMNRSTYEGIEISFIIESFKLVIIRDTVSIFIKNYSGNKFGKDFIDICPSLKKSDLIIFSQIKAKGADGTERELFPCEFMIE